MEENLNNNQQPTMQEPKKQEPSLKTKKNKAKIAVITLSTIIVLVLGLQIYAATNGYGNVFFMIRDWTTSKNATGENEVFVDEEKGIEEASEKELDVDSSLVKKLYDYIPAFDENRIRVNAYQNKKVTINDLDNTYLLAYTFKKMELKDSDKTTVTTANGEKIDGWYSFDATKLQEKAKEMFGTTLKNEAFEIGYGAGCDFENGKYYFSTGGGSGEWMTNIKNIERAYKENDLLFIEDKYIVIKEKDNKAGLYETSNGNKELEIIDLSNYTDDDTLSKYIIKKYSNKMISFKHTFKKNSDGNYYWSSTEPLEEIKETTSTTNTTNTQTQLEPDNYADEVMKEEVKKLFTNKLKKDNEKNTEKLLDYRVEKVEILSDIDKKGLVQNDDTEYFKNTDTLAEVAYSVKPKDINNTGWISGNGEISGEWIKNKIAYICVRNGEIVFSGTGW